MKTIFVGPQGIRAGWRFAIFVILLFGLSKLFFWILTVAFHYQEHDGWFPTDFPLDGALSFGAALLAAWTMSKVERRAFLEYGLPLRAMFRRHFFQGILWGFGASLVMRLLASHTVGRNGILASRRSLVGHLWCRSLFFQANGELDGRTERRTLWVVLLFHVAAHGNSVVRDRLPCHVRLRRHGVVRAAEHRKQRPRV